MKIFTSLLLYSILISNLFCQQGSTKFSFSLSGGITYNLEKAIFKKDLEGDTPLKLSYFDIKFYYNIDNKNSIGLSIGRNLFTAPKTFITGYGYSPLINPPETTFYYTDGNYLTSYWGISFNYKFNFGKKWYVSSEIGYLVNTYNGTNKFFSFQLGRQLPFAKQYFVDFGLAYSFLFKDLDNIMNSKQLTLKISFGINLN